MIYEGKIYGPYLRKDGRMHVLVYSNKKNKKTVSYPKFLMENHLGRFLLENETVDHKDCDFTNNEISNLRVIDRKQHIKEDIIRNKNIKVICKYCKCNFEIEGNKLHWRNRKDKGQSGYFCSRTCSGKHNKEIQMGLR